MTSICPSKLDRLQTTKTCLLICKLCFLHTTSAYYGIIANALLTQARSYRKPRRFESGLYQARYWPHLPIHDQIYKRSPCLNHHLILGKCCALDHDPIHLLVPSCLVVLKVGWLTLLLSPPEIIFWTLNDDQIKQSHDGQHSLGIAESAHDRALDLTLHIDTHPCLVTSIRESSRICEI